MGVSDFEGGDPLNTKHPLFQALAAPVARVWLTARRGWGLPLPGSLRILNFHESPQEMYPIFKRMVTRLQDEHRWTFVSPRDAESLLEGRGAACDLKGRTPCLLTFDDGFRSNYLLAREVLEPLGIRAVFFVCPGLLDLDAEHQKSAIAANIRLDPSSSGDAKLEHELMSWEELTALAASGHEIGSHGWSHRRLSGVDPVDLDLEVGRASGRLAEKLGRAPRWFAYPFGNAASIDSAALVSVAAHYSFCRSGVRGINDPGTPDMGLLSQTIAPSDSLDYQLAAATGALDFRYVAAHRELYAKLPHR